MTEDEEIAQYLGQRGILSLFNIPAIVSTAVELFQIFRRRAVSLSEGAVSRLVGMTLASRRAAQEITEFGTLSQDTIFALPALAGASRGVYNYTVIVEIPPEIGDIPRYITVTVQGGSEMTPTQLDEAIRREAERVLRESPPYVTLDRFEFTVIGVYRG